MNAPRYERSQGAGSRLGSSAPSRPNWVRVSGMDSQTLRELASKPSKRRLFAIVRRAEPSAPESKEQRRILLFDNHPDTLRLLFEERPKSKPGVAAPDRRRAFHLLLAASLICVLVAAMFWPLISQLSTHPKEAASNNSSVATQNPAEAQWQLTSARGNL
jgi:hypothetical protein